MTAETSGAASPGAGCPVYCEPSSPASAEIEVRRSRFIAGVRRVSSAEEARACVREERERHPGARHVVFAFLVGPESSETAGQSDDGEPKGTGGRPVLEVLRGSALRNALVTVTRYFGGTKLGTGPLARAYAGACKKAIEITPRMVFRQEKKYCIRTPYDCFDVLKRVFADAGCRVENEVFAEEASFEVFIPEGEEGSVLAAAGDVLRGRGEVR
jgi:uncharacterized YigZ family protein